MDAREISCERAVPADRHAIVELLRACALPVEDLPEVLPTFFVARRSEDLVGTVGLETFGDIALLRSLAVAEAWRGRGVARRLWERARECAVMSGAREVFLLTTTAEPIFACWGFARAPRDSAPAPIRNTPEFSSLCPSSAAFMRMALR